ncbi:MAG TPA: hypothetical protein EYG68_04950 [Leucothrix mucor]|nr:hypothetical protein [Leucothrix mucor]
MMTDRIPKNKPSFSVEQRLEYAKLMVDEGYTNTQVMEVSDAGSSAGSRWKKQYLEELEGKTPQKKKH